MAAVLYLLVSLVLWTCTGRVDGNLLSVSRLAMFVDELPDMPRIKGFMIRNGAAAPVSLEIGMYEKEWKFHRDLPPSRVFAYGTSMAEATVPGPTIEAVHGVDTYITWENYLPPHHILPWDPTIPTAVPVLGNGVPTVVHLHGGIEEPQSDGNSNSWFTAGFRQRGPTWTKYRYHYKNAQHPGNLWYHDHAMGLTRVNLLAGLFGAYTIHHPQVENPLGLPSGPEFDRPLVVFDRSFSTDGSIFMNRTGNNPTIHPQWQPEYFGDAIIVNGKAWPRLQVQRRKYRFRIINASNARYFRFFFTNTMSFTQVGSDSAYLPYPVVIKKLLLAPSEIADVIVDFSLSNTDDTILANDSPYPYPSGDPVNRFNDKVMKFIINRRRVLDISHVPRTLIRYPIQANMYRASKTRYISMLEYASLTNETTHLYLNGLSYVEPATEVPRAGTAEVWNVINLTPDNHPLHIHLGLFKTIEQRELVNVQALTECMNKFKDALKCHIERHTLGKQVVVPENERGWKNVYKMMPGHMTKILVQFSFIHSNAPYPFDVTAEPGYVYHCHMLDHEDNAMMRPMKFTY